MYKVCTNRIVIENRVMERGSLVDESELAGLSAYFLRLGFVEPSQIDAEESATLPPSMSRSLLRFMLPTKRA